jgi:hypothetical protein
MFRAFRGSDDVVIMESGKIKKTVTEYTQLAQFG